MHWPRNVRDTTIDAVRPIALMALLIAGCSTPPGGWDSPEPAARLEAVLEAGRTGDRSAIPRLIESLRHDDPVVRLSSIQVLEGMTGQSLGYDYAAPEWARRDKVAAWMAWYKEQSPESGTAGASIQDVGGTGIAR